MVIAIPNPGGAAVGPTRTVKHKTTRQRVAAGAIVAMGAVGVMSVRQGSVKPVGGHEKHAFRLFRFNPLNSTRIRKNTPKPRIHALAVDALSGAVGEIAALMALYPLDTLKVHCQARSLTTMQAVKEVAALGPAKAFSALYRGMGAAALGAAAMGSLYLVAFYGAKRMGTELVHRREISQENPSTSAAMVTAASGAFASIASSLVEAPVDAFKIRAQAGHLAAAHGGPLYASLIPFLLKAIPHDVAELFTYSQLNEAVSMVKRGSKSADRISLVDSLPCGVRDMLVGATAGTVAAVVSMPFDMTFTRMSLHATLGNAQHIAQEANKNAFRAFYRTARGIMMERNGGVCALFAGLAPRLLQTVPAAMVYWVAVEATRRALHSRCDIVDADSSRRADHVSVNVEHSSQSDSDGESSATTAWWNAAAPV